MWKFVKEPPPKAVLDAKHARPAFADYFSVLRYRNMWLCCLAAAGFISWLFLLNVFAPLYITREAHQTATTAGFLLGASGLGSFFIGLVFPGLSDRFGRRPILLLMACMCTVVPLALLVPHLYAVPWILAGILFLTNAGQGVASLTMVLVPTESVPPQFAATSIGLATLVGELFGATAAPTLGGALAKRYGLATPLWMAALGSAAIFLLALLLRETAQARATKATASSAAVR
jgi:predicted MFS family arabinose efflux permease